MSVKPPPPPPPSIPLDVLARAAADLQALHMHLAVDPSKPVPAELAVRLARVHGEVGFYAHRAMLGINILVK